MSLNSRLSIDFERAIGILRHARELSQFLDRLVSTSPSHAHLHYLKTENTEDTQINASSTAANQSISAAAATTFLDISASKTLSTKPHEPNPLPMTSCQGCQSRLGRLPLRADFEQDLHRQQQEHPFPSGSEAGSSLSGGSHSGSSRGFVAPLAMLDSHSMSNYHVPHSTETAISNLALSGISLSIPTESTSSFAAQIEPSAYIQDALQCENAIQEDSMGEMGHMLAATSDNLSNSATWSVPDSTYDLPNIHETDRQSPFDLATSQSTMSLAPAQVHPVDSHSPMFTPTLPSDNGAKATCNERESTPPLADSASLTSAVAGSSAPSSCVDTSSSLPGLTDMRRKSVSATSDERQSQPQNKQNKRKRRASHEVWRKYSCNFPGCKKAYGELQHLNTHIVQMSHGPKRKKKDFNNPSRSSQTSQDQLFGATLMQALRDLWSLRESGSNEAASSDMTLNQLRQALFARPSGSSTYASTRRSSRSRFPSSQDTFQRSSSNRPSGTRRESSCTQSCSSNNRENRSRHPTVGAAKVRRRDKHASHDSIDNDDARDNKGHDKNVEDDEDELSDETMEGYDDPCWGSGTDKYDNEDEDEDEDEDGDNDD